MRTPTRHAALVLLASVAFGATACGSGKMSAGDAEAYFDQRPMLTHYPPVHCENGTDGWDYVCTDSASYRYGVNVDSTQFTFSTPPLPPGQPLPPSPQT